MTRRRLPPEQSRAMILDAAVRLMLQDGYAAVTTRRVAAEAEIKPPLVHYYFSTTDDLFRAIYRRSTDRMRARLKAATLAERPLEALWDVNRNPELTGLTTEFLALANHRKSIQIEIANIAEEFRTMQIDVVRQIADRLPDGWTPEAVVFIIAAIGRSTIMESTIGVSNGHDAAITLVESLINAFGRESATTMGDSRGVGTE